MNIAICDDDKLVCAEIEKIIKDYMLARYEKSEVDIFYSAASLKTFINKESAYDLIFLDIEMDEVNGIEFGQWLRETTHDEITKIVYISAKEKYAMNLFRIRPLDFLKKPVQAKDVVYNIEKCLELIREQGQCFPFRVEHETKQVPIMAIAYFESANRIIHMHTTEGETRFYDKLEEVMERVDGRFFWRIHKSYLIHIRHVERFEYKKVVMDTGRELPISQVYRSDIRRLQLEMLRREDSND